MSDKIVKQFIELERLDRLQGVYEDIPEEAYNDPRFPGVRSSLLKTVVKRSYHHAINSKNEDKAHLTTGKIFHEFIEGVPQKELREKHSLTFTDLEQFQQMSNSVRSHPRFDECYARARREVTMFAKCPYTGLLLRSRCDLWTPATNLIADYKTTLDASLEGFSRSARKFGYRMSACFYGFIANLVTKQDVHEFRIITVEKEPPYFSSQYFYSSESFELDTESMIEGLRRIKQAREGGNTGYTAQVTELRY